MTTALAFEDLADDEKHSVRTWRPPSNSMLRVAIPRPAPLPSVSDHEVDREWEALLRPALPANSLPAPVAAASVDAPPLSRPTFPRTYLHYGQDSITITLELPGFELSDIEVAVSPDVITLSGRRQDVVPVNAECVTRERPQGAFRRSIKLLHRVDPNSTRARCGAGVLALQLERAKTTRSIVVREI